MPWFSRKYYREEDTPTGYRNLESGYALLMHNPLFQQLEGTILTKASHLNEKGSIACVFKKRNHPCQHKYHSFSRAMVLRARTQPAASGIWAF